MSLLKDNVIYGGDISSNITAESESLADFVLKRLEKIGEKTILINALSGQEVSGKDILKQVTHLATCLQNLNIKEGDVVGICAENRIEFIEIMFATFCLNATFVPLNVTYTEREIHHAVNLSHPKIIFLSPQFAEKVSKIIRTNSFIQYAFVFSEESAFSNMKPYSSLINNFNIERTEKYIPKPANINENVAIIFYSSGTTGLPKGVQTTQKNVMSVINLENDSKQLWKKLTILNVLPWFHCFGCIAVICASMLKFRMVYLAKFEEVKFLNTIEKYKVNIVLVVPPIMIFLAKHPLIDRYDLSSLMILFCGGAPLRKETEEAIRKRIKVPFINQGYGLSETTFVVVEQTNKFNKPGSIGVVRASLFAKVIDIETGKLLEPYQKGELCFKGDTIMKGYIDNLKSTQDVIDKDGWLHTGDIGYYDNDFEFFIVDRIKELIKYKAFQVPPAEIEALLLTHPKIKDAAVVGLSDEECGELPFAFVVKEPNAKLTEQDVINFIDPQLSPAKRIRGGVQFIENIPKNASGKILRRVLRDMLKVKQVKSKL